MRFPVRLEVTRSELMQAKRFQTRRRCGRVLASFVSEARRLALADRMGGLRVNSCVRFDFFLNFLWSQTFLPPIGLI